MNVDKIRADFPVLQRKIHGKPIVYLDNAATTLKPNYMIDAIRKYYEEQTANVHRGLHKLSEEASIEYEQSHRTTEKFLGAQKGEVCFTKNTTEAINTVMYALYNSDKIKKGDKIVVSKMEHHSNIVPWQFLEKKVGAKLEFVELDKNYQLDMADFEKKVKGAKLVSITGASNTVASLPDIRAIEKLSHKEGALVCIDAAQLVPHKKVDFRSLNADFLCFSGHKMLAPTGIGALVAKKKLLEDLEPFMFGGDMIHSVDWHKSSWNELPYKYEAGTPNIEGAYGLKAAIEYLNKIGFNDIESQEKKLTKLCLEELSRIKGVKTYCPGNAEKQGGIVMFGCDKLSAHDTALALSESENVFIRSGMHCAEPLVSSLNKDGLARASFYFYNSETDILKFSSALKEVLSAFG
ncbi:MAG: SufS family cysteine desulfurase [archaeon]